MQWGGDRRSDPERERACVCERERARARERESERRARESERARERERERARTRASLGTAPDRRGVLCAARHVKPRTALRTNCKGIHAHKSGVQEDIDTKSVQTFMDLH